MFKYNSTCECTATIKLRYNEGTAMESELQCVMLGYLCEVRIYSLLFDISKRIVGLRYRRFGTTY